MTVSTELSHEEYVGNGVTTDFDFRFRIFEGKHLIVVVADSDGNEKTLKNGTDYTIVGAGSYHGGKVVLNKPLAQGWKILLERDLPVVQETDLRNQGKFFAEVHEDAFDYLTMLIQKALGTFSLSLRKPTYLSNYYDAKGNCIANLAQPKFGTDSANKDYVDNSIKDIDSKTLRVKDKPINALPNTQQRANKILAFDNNGQPITVLPESGSASDVLIELASSIGASLIGTINGNNVQTELSDLSEKTNYLYGLVDFVKITDYSDLAEGDDWTSAIQAALDTGKPVYGSGIYKVSKKLKSKGQRLIGDWFINALHMPDKLKIRSKIPAKTDHLNVNFPIRMIYSSVAWDLCDMLAIKSLGFTVVHSYAGFSGHESAAGGDVKTLLDNCLSAGLKVQLGTEDALNASNANMTLKEFIEAFDGHDALFGYSVFDEPATRRISVSDQDKKISEMRALTNKALTCVDLVEGANSPFYENWSKNYDIFFVNSYAQHYEDGDFTSWVRRDEQKNRIDVGGVIAMSRCAKIIPVVGMFVSSSGQYSRDRDQLITNSLFFGKKGGGEYGCFIWDLPFESTPNAAVNVSPQFQDACYQLSKQPYTGNSPDTDVYIFGGAPGYQNYGVSSIIDKLIVVDPNNIQKSGWEGAYPAMRAVGSNIYCGIGFKNANSTLPTTIDCKKYVSYYLDAFGTLEIPNGVKLRFSGSLGSGFGGPISPDYDLASHPTFIGSTMYGGDSRNKMLTISVVDGKNTDNYELFIRGMIVCTDW
ncbi:hypothetical protein ACDV99_10885 [Proteus mirabilis]|uniref:hypothetical protein n=1 Tax=Proteus mirabilis TaxID=584 RepID=UPI001A2BA5D5|nr:hypothetical protein [Proteus mirabilis]ELA9959177.1 hypothetical protein [Proteus mirabilis]MCT8254422.1 hypothetical protein [Proteus mirabilis]MDM3751670.1 hypothetical protein [Proteus mirabilis]HAT6271094.1 hypothetical protein [Proteus mirabilis]HAT6274834.1 hypothetical protein [Proteus mirabilis]